MAREFNTPLGSLSYGRTGETNFARLANPALDAAMGVYNGRGDLGAYAGVGDYQANIGRYMDNLNNPTLFASMNYPDNAPIPDYERNINTPLGQIGIGTNDGNKNVYGTFTPNQYIQALANLLRGRL